jgi:hypothetical protein
MTMVPPVPRPVPHAAMLLESSGMSSSAQSNSVPLASLPLKRSPTLRILVEEPPGMIALILRPSSGPPQRSFHQAADAPDVRAAVAGDADLGELRAAEGEHMLHLRHRLRVVDDGRAVVEAEDGREIRGLDARVAALAFKGLDQAGLFAADIAASAPVDDDLAGVARAEDVLAEEALGLRFGDRALEDLGAVDELAADVDEGLLGLDGPRGDRDAFQHLVRVLVDDLAVLVGAGFGFVGVDDQVGGLARLTVEELPLHAGGEAGAAAAAQAGRLHFLADFLGLEGDGFLEGFVTAVAQVAVDIDRVPRLAEVGVDERAFDGGHVAERSLN